MPTRHAKAEWKGDLAKGVGHLSLGSGLYEGGYTFASRFENGKGTNPEELIAAAYAGCYSMALSADLSKSGFNASSITTTANVTIDKVGDGVGITGIELICNATVPGIDKTKFNQFAEATKKNCPVSKALSAVPTKLTATLA